jgi:hypothetical protein
VLGDDGDLVGDVHHAVAEGWPSRLDQIAQLVVGQHPEISAPVPDRRQPSIAQVEHHTDPTRSEVPEWLAVDVDGKVLRHGKVVLRS